MASNRHDSFKGYNNDNGGNCQGKPNTQANRDGETFIVSPLKMNGNANNAAVCSGWAEYARLVRGGNSPSNQCTQENSRRTDPEPNTPPLVEYVRRDRSEQKKSIANVTYVCETASLKPLLGANNTNNQIRFSITTTLTFKQEQYTDS